MTSWRSEVTGGRVATLSLRPSGGRLPRPVFAHVLDVLPHQTRRALGISCENQVIQAPVLACRVPELSPVGQPLESEEAAASA